jgi:hypothetical protein
MSPCNSNIYPIRCYFNTVYLYLETALHVSGGTSTHHQERIQLYLQHLALVTPLLLPTAIVEELELQSLSLTHTHRYTRTHAQCVTTNL